MQIAFTKRFLKMKERLQEPIRQKLKTRIALFSEHMFDPLLRNHPLQGAYTGKRSIDITGDYRAIYWEDKQAGIAFFEAVGTHSQLYG